MDRAVISGLDAGTGRDPTAKALDVPRSAHHSLSLGGHVNRPDEDAVRVFGRVAGIDDVEARLVPARPPESSVYIPRRLCLPPRDHHDFGDVAQRLVEGRVLDR